MKTTMSVSSEQQRFRTLYDAFRPEVLAYCTRRVSAAEAADACSETFLVVWRRIDVVPAPPNTLPFLYGIARRVIANQRRSRHRRIRLHERLSSLGVTPPADPCVLYVQSERDRRVASAVRRLGPKDREILMLYAWEDLPREAIGELMGMTRAAIDQRIHRSCERLARVLRSELSTGAAVSPRQAEGGSA